MLSTRASLLAENLFLRRQLALFQERKTKPRRTTPSTRLAMLALARFFDWREALTVVKPETFLKWHRTGLKLFWRWKSRNPGRPPLPKNIAELVRRVTQEKPTWGEQRIANGSRSSSATQALATPPAQALYAPKPGCPVVCGIVKAPYCRLLTNTHRVVPQTMARTESPLCTGADVAPNCVTVPLTHLLIAICAVPPDC